MDPIDPKSQNPDEEVKVYKSSTLDSEENTDNASLPSSNIRTPEDRGDQRDDASLSESAESSDELCEGLSWYIIKKILYRNLKVGASTSVSASKPSVRWLDSHLLPEQAPQGERPSALEVTADRISSSGLFIDYKDELINGESYFGFVEDEADALVLIQATIANIISAFSGSSVDMARLQVRSGSVFVLEETSRFVKRWKDGLQWSPSRSYGPFLLYRQVTETGHSPVEQTSNEAALRIPGVDPAFSESTLKSGTQILAD
ncbi:hypothetical protein HDU82_009032, partial [Entophlyctis luteolus]